MKLWLMQTIVGVVVILVAMIALNQKAKIEVRHALLSAGYDQRL